MGTHSPKVDRLVSVGVRCPLCRVVHSHEVLESELTSFSNGTAAVRAFPTMPDDAREAFISGICSGCWAEKIAPHHLPSPFRSQGVERLMGYFKCSCCGRQYKTDGSEDELFEHEHRELVPR